MNDSKLKVEIDGAVLATHVKIEEVLIGTVFFGTFQGQTRLFLRIYDGVVDLQKPAHVWTRQVGMEFENYRPVQSARLVVEA